MGKGGLLRRRFWMKPMHSLTVFPKAPGQESPHPVPVSGFICSCDHAATPEYSPPLTDT